MNLTVFNNIMDKIIIKKLKKYFRLVPLRIGITDYCNLRCFFCSNEGMPLFQRNKKHIDIKKIKYLIEVLIKAGLKNLSITGGEPTLHPEFENMIDFLSVFNFKNLFLHTNGISLNKKIIKKLSKNFTKIAISLHSANFSTWKKMTRGTKQQFIKIISNLELLTELNNKSIIELKIVPIRKYNYSIKEFKDFLNLCDKFGFKFKFLNFEPILPVHLNLVIPFKEIKKYLIQSGCILDQKDNKFRGQFNYLPIENFIYNNIMGVAIEMGCGTPEACKWCWKANEIFITPELKIKPCHVSNFQIDLEKDIKRKNENNIFESILRSREFLLNNPAIGIKIWQNNS